MTAGLTWVASWPWCRRIPGWSSPLPPCSGLILTQPGGCRCSPVPARLGRRRQRRVFVAIVLNGVPLDALVIELASNRNAIYKTLFDARRKLRAALAANGYIGED